MNGKWVRRWNAIKLQYFTVEEKLSHPFISIPLFLWEEDFQGLSTDAKLLYGLLLSRTELSRKNGWIVDGKIYVMFTIKTAMEKLYCCEQKAVALMKALERCGLIERQRKQNNQAYRIFLKQPVKIIGQPVKNEASSNENHGSEPVKITRYRDRNNRDRINQINTERKHPYGCNENVWLTDLEYQALKEEFPRDYQRRIDHLSSYMLAKNRSYSDHAAVIQRWAKEDEDKTKVAKKPNYRHSEGVSL